MTYARQHHQGVPASSSSGNLPMTNSSRSRSRPSSRSHPSRSRPSRRSLCRRSLCSRSLCSRRSLYLRSRTRVLRQAVFPAGMHRRFPCRTRRTLPN